MKIQAIIPAGGTGSRLRSAVAKPLVSLKGRPVLHYVLKAFQACRLIESIVLVGHRDIIDGLTRLVQRGRFTKVRAIVTGGKTRSCSVRNGLAVVEPDTELVVVHDAARPLVTDELIERTVRGASGADGAIAAVPVKPTIKKIDPRRQTVRETLDRTVLWEVQTPQVFKRDVLAKAHRLPGADKATDDAVLVERLGGKVKVVMGSYANIKITTAEDVILAGALLGIKGKV